MSTQPEALRLALALEKYWGPEYGADRELQAAAELRRLHEVNQELLGALRVAVCEIADWGSYASEYFQNKHDLKGAISRASAVIIKATGEANV